jgi:hypothetical protein
MKYKEEDQIVDKGKVTCCRNEVVRSGKWKVTSANMQVRTRQRSVLGKEAFMIQLSTPPTRCITTTSDFQRRHHTPLVESALPVNITR